MFWNWLDRLSIVVSLVAAYFAFRAWLKSTELIRANRQLAERRRAPITIRLQARSADGKSRTLDLPYKPRRDQLSRGELAGMLSFYFGESRYDPSIMRKIMEDGSLTRVLAGDLERSSEDELLVIQCPLPFLETIEKRVKTDFADGETPRLVTPAGISEAEV